MGHIKARRFGATQHENSRINSDICRKVLSIGLRFPSTALRPLMLRSDRYRLVNTVRAPHLLLKSPPTCVSGRLRLTV